jgi:hypothetical protein
MAMASKGISVEIYTASHRVLGRAHPGATGLSSYLNIPTTSYVEIKGAHLMRLHQPGRLVARHPTLWLVKGEIVVILLSSRAEIGPISYARGGYSSAVPHWVRIIMGGYELQGSVETPGKFNFGSLMFEGDSIFFPIYQAILSAILFPNVRGEAPAMLINRHMVDAVALLSKDEIPQSAPKEQ